MSFHPFLKTCRFLQGFNFLSHFQFSAFYEIDPLGWMAFCVDFLILNEGSLFESIVEFA